MKKTRLLQNTKITPTITIREYVSESGRYFTATIRGWRNFKFTSVNLTAQELLIKTIEKCKEMDATLRDDLKNIENLPSIFTF